MIGYWNVQHNLIRCWKDTYTYNMKSSLIDAIMILESKFLSLRTWKFFQKISQEEKLS